MIWYKLIHRFAKLEEQQFSNTSRFAKQKRQNQTKDDKSTFFFQMFFPDVLSRQRAFRHEKPIETCCFCCVCHVNLLILVKMCCFPFCSSLLMSAEVLLSYYIYIYIACIYFGFWFSIFGLTSTKRVFEHVSQRIKGAFKSQGPDFTTENMRNTSKRLMSDGTST